VLWPFGHPIAQAQWGHRPAGASSIASGPPIAIEAAAVAGSITARRIDVANIGSFKKSGNEFQGEIFTLYLQTNGVRIALETNRSSDNAPSHRVYLGRAEVGAAWSKRSEESRNYLSLKLDDPSLNTPIYASLFADEDGDGYTRIWSRPRRTATEADSPTPCPVRRAGLSPCTARQLRADNQSGCCLIQKCNQAIGHCLTAAFLSVPSIASGHAPVEHLRYRPNISVGPLSRAALYPGPVRYCVVRAGM
jgi:uncharacterized protein (DUF736 family)